MAILPLLVLVMTPHVSGAADGRYTFKAQGTVPNSMMVGLRGGGLEHRRTIPVTFEVRCDNTSKEERVLLIGSEPVLGQWDPLEAVEMATNTTIWPLWSATVSLPAGQIVEYKYAISTKRGWNATAFGFNATGAGVERALEAASGVAAGALRRYGGRAKHVEVAEERPQDVVALVSNETLIRSPVEGCTNSSSALSSDEAQILEEWQFLRNGLVFDWEEGGNHLLKVGRRQHLVADEFLPPLRNPDPIPPSFVHGGQKSEFFMDAEYSFIATD